MKKRILSLLLALVMVISMIPVTAHAAENIDLTVWVTPGDDAWIFDRLDAFEAANPQWNISWDIGTCPAGDVVLFLSEDPIAAADVFFFTSDSRASMLERNALLPLTSGETAQAAKLTSQTLMNTLMDENGICYGFPVSGNTWFLYYDKRVFSEEDVKSLETMLTKGKVAFPLTNSWYLPAFYFANGCTMFGQYGMNESHGIRFNGDRGAAVTRRLAELVKEPNLYIDQNFLSSYVLSDGTASAFFSGAWDYEYAYRFLGENLGAAQLPTITIDGQPKQMKSFLSCTAVGVNAYTEHKDAARALAKFLSNEKTQRLRWEATGAFPAASALTTDPEIASNVAVKAQIDTQNNTSTPQPAVAAMNLYWGPAGVMSNWLLDGEITATNAAARTEEWNARLNGGENPPPFTDVPAGIWFEKPVLWALENGVTSGSSETTFSPGDKCLRAHVVTFLWNAEKCPEPAAASSTFTDVPAGAWYEKPVLWAVEHGITSGTSATKFGADDVCSRYQVVFFLWKAAGSPEPKTTVNPFTDVNPGHFFYKAVLWAVENGITSGTSATTFGPTVPCNRAQVVTFLYAAYN